MMLFVWFVLKYFIFIVVILLNKLVLSLKMIFWDILIKVIFKI